MESTENKVMGVLSYLSILVLIPILIGPKTSFVRTHANQGLVLCIIELLCRIVLFFIGWIPLIGWIIRKVVGLVTLAVIILAIVGIVYAIQGKTKELPIVGQIKLLS